MKKVSENNRGKIANGLMYCPESIVRLFLLLILFITISQAKAQQLEEFYVPLRESAALDFFTDISADANPPLITRTDIVIREPGTVVIFDPTADGYETQYDDDSLWTATTASWGDADCSNGFNPNLAACIVGTDDALDVLTVGEVIVFDANQVFASDYFRSNKILNLTRSAWPSGTGTFLAGAFELFPIAQWGTTYVVPIGENTANAGAMFQQVAVTIMAQNDNTIVSFDPDGPGVATPIVAAINRGETLEYGIGSLLPNGQALAINEGATLTASAPIQANVLTGDNGSTYEARFYTLFPDALLSNEYYEAVASTDAANPAAVFLFNPSTNTVIVDYFDNLDPLANPTSVNVPPNASTKVVMPGNTANGLTGVRFASRNGEVFTAYTIVDDDGQIHDWGHVTTPLRLMGDTIRVGFAPGNDPNSADLLNASPIWVIADVPGQGSGQDIELCVDVAGDGDGPAAGGGTDPVTLREYDYTVIVQPLDTVRLYDAGPDSGAVLNNGNDQTGMLAFACNSAGSASIAAPANVVMAAAWGQDPARTGSGDSGFDVGTTIRTGSVNKLFLGDLIFEDLNGNGVQDLGEIGLANVDVTISTSNPIVDVDPNTAGIQNSLTIQTNSSGLYLFTALTVDVDYTVTVTPPAGFSPVSDPDGILDNSTTITLTSSVLTQDFGYSKGVDLAKSSDANGGVRPGDILTYTLTPSFVGSGVLTNLIVTDPIPLNTTYVGDSDTPEALADTDPLEWNLGSTTLDESVSVSAVAGSTLTFIADRDTFIDENKPDDNFGNGNDIEVSIESGATKEKRGLTHWNINSIANDAVVLSASMEFYSNNNKDVVVESRRLTTDWTEGAGTNGQNVDWNNSDTGTLWATAGGDFDSSVIGSFTQDTTAVWDVVSGANVTNLAQNWVNGTWGNFGVILASDGSADKDDAIIRTVDQAANLAPKLNITLQGKAATSARLTAQDSLVSDGSTIILELLLNSDTTTTVSPGALTIVDQAGGANAVSCSVPSAQTITAGVELSVAYTCTAQAGASLPSGLAFRADNIVSTTNSSGVDFVPDATNEGPKSNSVLIVPAITFQVTVDDPLPTGITQIANTATATDDFRFPPGVATVIDPVTPVAGPNGIVWLDSDGDGVLDAGEPGIAAVTVYLCAAGVSPCNVGNALDSVQTDANGEYSFPYLVISDYQIQVEPFELTAGGELLGLDETVGNLAGNTGTETIVVGGPNYTKLGYVPVTGTGVVEGTVWTDADGDGMQDANEVGIPGAMLELCPAVDPSCVSNTPLSATTGADGSYIIVGVDPGEYVVSVNPATVPAGYLATTPTTSNPISVPVNGVVSDIDFGFNSPNTQSISDAVWYDSDGDGILDPNENGIGGVTVDLYDCGPDNICGNADDIGIVATVTTSADGGFDFTGVPNGNYEIQISDNSGVLNVLDETTATGGTVPVTVNGLDIDNTATPSFGYNQPGSVTGNVFSDASNDGNYDLNESGVPIDAAGNPIIIELRDGSCTPSVDCLTATVNADGSYAFSSIPPGILTVVITNPPAGGATTLESIVVTLLAGGSVADVNFGYNDPALDDITGTVFRDLDADGTYEPNGTDGNPVTTADNEPAIAEVTLELIDCGAGTCFDGDETLLAMTVSATDGSYAFNDVPDGNYLVQVTDDANALDGMDLTSGLDQRPVTTDSTIPGNPDPIDFGYIDDAQTAAITSGAWIDVDGDGVRGAGETPIAGVDIDLIDCGPDGICGGAGAADDTLVATAITDAEGNVIFPNLAPGNYQLDLDETDPDLPADFVETTYTGVNPNTPIALSEGESYDADFGYVSNPALGALSGALWSDADADGIKDIGEAPLAGITVTLTDLNGSIVATAVTGPDGRYAFTGLTPCASTIDCYGIYYDKTAVDATGLNGQEPTNTTDSNGDGLNDDHYQAHLSAGEIIGDLNYGFAGPDDPACTVAPCDPTVSEQVGSIEGVVYYEPAATNPNGSFDAGSDTGIEQVSLNLVDASGNIIATTFTGDGTQDVNGDGLINSDDIGYYRFAGIVPGSGYQVVVSDTSNALIGQNPSGDPDEAGICAICDGTDSAITVLANTVITSNFGYIGEQTLGNIGNLIWLDVVNDGIFSPDDGDIGLAGVTVQCWVDTDSNGIFGNGLFGPNGIDNLIRTVTTDANGEYYCEGLPTGTYFVRVTDTVGVLNGFSAATVLGGTGALTDTDNTNKVDIIADHAWLVATGSDNLTADFAVSGSFSISGNVFIEDKDLVEPDDNGTLEPNELDATPGDGDDVPAEGVTMLLLREQPDGSFIQISSVLTNATGDYTFSSLPPGNYQVVVDPDGSPIDGFGQTADPDLTSMPVSPEEKVCDSNTAALCDNTASISLTANVAGVNFGYQDNFVTTPVTVDYFMARRVGGGIEFEWAASNEVGHAGYQIFARTNNGWKLLNEQLIVSQGSASAMSTVGYSYTAYDVDAKWFSLVDVSVAEVLTPHGPFEINKRYGEDLERPAVFDWSVIAGQNSDSAETASSLESRLEHLRGLDIADDESVQDDPDLEEELEGEE